MICSDWPNAYEVWVRRSDTDHGWRRYSIYGTYKQAESTVKRVEGAPLELKIVPLYAAIDNAMREGE